MRPSNSERGQATLEFALIIPFVGLIIGCILGVTAACLDALRLDDLARTAARLASVSADPADTARTFVASHARGVRVDTRVTDQVVAVVLIRQLSVHVPLLPRLSAHVPWSATSVMALEPPIVSTSAATSVKP